MKPLEIVIKEVGILLIILKMKIIILNYIQCPLLIITKIKA
jgi:hypothetical protein